MLTVLLTVAVAADYKPTVQGDVTKLDAPTVAILRRLPGIPTVSVAVAVEKPTHRIVHVRDWHYVGREPFAADLRDQGASDAEIERLYEKHLATVEKVQAEQMTALRALIEHHGLKRVYVEGIAVEDRGLYDAKIAAVRKAHWTLVELMKEAVERKDVAFTQTVAVADRTHQRELLRIGAAGRLYMREEIEAVPVESRAARAKARPVGDDGSFKLDTKANEAREDAIVRNLLAGPPVAFVVLGGAHDLKNNVERLGGGRVEYVVVTVTGYPHDSGKSPSIPR